MTYLFNHRSNNDASLAVTLQLFLADYALFNHTFDAIHVSDVSECATRCMGNGACQSYNIQTGNSANKQCELNNQSRTSKPKDFKQRRGFNYYGLVPVQFFLFFFFRETLVSSFFFSFPKKEPIRFADFFYWFFFMYPTKHLYRGKTEYPRLFGVRYGLLLEKFPFMPRRIIWPFQFILIDHREIQRLNINVRPWVSVRRGRHLVLTAT